MFTPDCKSSKISMCLYLLKKCLFLISVPFLSLLFLFIVPLPHSGELMPSKWALVTDRLLVLSRRFSDILSKVQEFLWRLLELHILKMVAFFAVWVALEEVQLYFYFSPTYPPILTPPPYIVMLKDEQPLH